MCSFYIKKWYSDNLVTFDRLHLQKTVKELKREMIVGKWKGENKRNGRRGGLSPPETFSRRKRIFFKTLEKQKLPFLKNNLLRKTSA